MGELSHEHLLWQPLYRPVCPAAQGETLSYTPEDYQVGVKMRYLFHDGAATLGYLRQGDWRRALAGVADFFRTPEALYRKDDKGAYRAYLRNSLKGR